MSMFVVAPKEKFGLAKLEDDISSHLGKRIVLSFCKDAYKYIILNSLLSKSGVGNLLRKDTVFCGGQILKSNASRMAIKKKNFVSYNHASGYTFPFYLHA
jgi:hypothetical protein